jgi:four helix bundle protein
MQIRCVKIPFWEKRLASELLIVGKSQTLLTHVCDYRSRGQAMGQSYRQLIAWQKAMRFVTEIYEATRLFPRDELYGLISQLRRAAVSVPSNIAEGQARFSRREFHHFLSHAEGRLLRSKPNSSSRKTSDISPDKQARYLLKNATEIGPDFERPNCINKIRSLNNPDMAPETVA